MRLHSDYERIKGILDRIPPEIIKAYTHRSTQKTIFTDKKGFCL